MELIQLRWADAGTLAALMSDGRAPSTDQLHGYRQDWVNGFGERAARALPRDFGESDAQWMYGAGAEAAPTEQIGGGSGGGLSRLVPRGLDGPPIAVPQQNALLVKGTPLAIDQFREVVALLDKPPRMVNVEVVLQDSPQSSTDDRGIDFQARDRDLTVSSRGNLPASGAQVRYRRDGSQIAVGVDRTSSKGQVMTGANITTTNNVPAVITTGSLLPYETATVSYDQFGNRRVDYQVDAIFIGMELFVQPTINNDDTVTMLLRPTFIESIGTIVGPNGVSLPITETVGALTKITVPDGETVPLGGFIRSEGEYSSRFAGVLRKVRGTMRSQPCLFVTPRIIRALDGDNR